MSWENIVVYSPDNDYSMYMCNNEYRKRGVAMITVMCVMMSTVYTVFLKKVIYVIINSTHTTQPREKVSVYVWVMTVHKTL